MRRLSKFFIMTVMLLLVVCLSKTLLAEQNGAVKPSKEEFTQKPQKLQMPFIANDGQTDERVQFYAKTFGGSVFVTKDGEIVYSLPSGMSEEARSQKQEEGRDDPDGASLEAGDRKQEQIAEGQGIMNYGPRIPLNHATEYRDQGSVVRDQGETSNF